MFTAAVTSSKEEYRKEYTVHTGMYSAKSWKTINGFLENLSRCYSTNIVQNIIYGYARRGSDGEVVIVVEFYGDETDSPFSMWLKAMQGLCQQIVDDPEKFSKKLQMPRQEMLLSCRMILGTMNSSEKQSLVGQPWNPLKANQMLVIFNDLMKAFKICQSKQVFDCTDAFFEKRNDFVKMLSQA